MQTTYRMMRAFSQVRIGDSALHQLFVTNTEDVDAAVLFVPA